MKRTRILLVLPLLLSGCTHTIKYKLTEEDRWTGPKIGGTVRVDPITDRTPYEITDWKPKHIEKGTWTTNSRGGYNHTNLTEEVTAMIAKHLAHSGLFSKVLTGRETNADYTLSGALTDFKALGRVNQTAKGIQAGAAVGGAIGAIIGAGATAGMKSEIRTSVKLEDLQLADRSGQSLWRDSISITNDQNLHYSAADKPAIYQFPDRALKDAVKEMIHRLSDQFQTNQPRAALP